jgi:hypothetical protein
MQSVQGLIDQAIADEQAKRSGRERSGKWSPSSFGKCYRAQFWNRKNVKPTNLPDERKLRVFKAGDLFHDFVKGLIAKSNNIKEEVKCESEDVKGYADMVGETCVWDIKSQHSGAFHYMTKSSDISADKKPNILQVLWYAQHLGLKEGRLVFISKDDLCIQEYGFPLNEKWSSELSQELSTLRDYWKNEALPDACPRAYIDKKSGKSKECSFCAWLDLCKNQGGMQWSE